MERARHQETVQFYERRLQRLIETRNVSVPQYWLPPSELIFEGPNQIQSNANGTILSFANRELYIEARLKASGFEIPAGATDEQLNDLLARAERNEPGYESWSVAEIAKAITQRGVTATTSRQTRSWKTNAIQQLRQDDDTKVFPLLSLPKDIRLQIYELHLHDLGATLSNPVQPPLTMVSKQVRAESLEAFYKESNFMLDFDFRINSNRRLIHIGLAPETRDYLAGNSTIDVAQRERIRKLIVRFRVITALDTATIPFYSQHFRLDLGQRQIYIGQGYLCSDVLLETIGSRHEIPWARSCEQELRSRMEKAMPIEGNVTLTDSMLSAIASGFGYSLLKFDPVTGLLG